MRLIVHIDYNPVILLSDFNQPWKRNANCFKGYVQFNVDVEYTMSLIPHTLLYRGARVTRTEAHPPSPPFSKPHDRKRCRSHNLSGVIVTPPLHVHCCSTPDSGAKNVRLDRQQGSNTDYHLRLHAVVNTYT